VGFASSIEMPPEPLIDRVSLDDAGAFVGRSEERIPW
jgi:hypothetical protein